MMNLEDATSGFLRNDKKVNTNRLMESCRACMERSDIMSCIFDSGKRNIMKEIQFCTGIQLQKDDGLPSSICNTCLDNLSIAYQFKISYLLADETFRKMNVTVKIENIDSTNAYDDLDMIDYLEYGDKVKQEIAGKIDEVALVTHNSVQKKKLVKLKKENDCAKSENNPSIPLNDRLCLTRSGKPRRMKQFKFKKLECEPCGLKFKTKEQSINHKREKHPESGHWICEVCGKVFIHRASHYTHLRSHLPPKYACDQCDYKTGHKYDLVKHIRIHTGTKMYQCEYCTLSYYTSSNLTGHIRRTHLNLRPHQCTVCRKSFFDKTKLNRHMDSHNEVKRFECDVCRACFTRRCYWKKHLFRQHNVTVPPQRPGRQKTNLVVGDHNDLKFKDLVI